MVSPASGSSVRAYLKQYAPILFLTLSGAAVRFVQAGSRSLWDDEATYSWIALQTLDQWFFPFTTEIIGSSPPLNIYLVSGAYHLFGHTTAFTARSVSLTAGVLTIPAIYLLGKMLYNRSTGIVAALLMAVSSIHIVYSRQVHWAAPGLFFLTLSAYLILRSFHDPTAHRVASATITALLGIATHIMNLALLPFAVAVALLTKGERGRLFPRPWIAGGGILLVSALIGLFIVTAWETHPPRFLAFWDGPQLLLPAVAAIKLVQLLLQTMIAAPGTLLEGFSIYFDLYLGSMTAYTTLLLVLIPLSMFLYRWRQDQTLDRGTVLCLSLLAPILLILLIAEAALHHIVDVSAVRVSPFLLVPALLLAARGAVLLHRRHRAAAYLLLTVFVLTQFTYIFSVVIQPVHLETDGRITYPADSIVCSETAFPHLFCFQHNPLGPPYEDALDWRQAGQLVDAHTTPDRPLYISFPTVFRFYATTPEQYTIRPLTCNDEHVSCNISARLDTDEPFWLATDPRRRESQLMPGEWSRLNTECKRVVADPISLFACG